MMALAGTDWALGLRARFSQRRAYVCFDWRGTGQSDPRPASSIDELVLDLEAVVRALGEAPDLLAPSGGCFPACTFVAQQPGAARSLLLSDPMVRFSESPQATMVRGGYYDYELYLYSVARAFFPIQPVDEFNTLVREWARQVPEPVHHAYTALLAEADLSTTLQCVKAPVLVHKRMPSSAAASVASLVPGSVLVEREYGYLGERGRADWDEHIGSRFGETPEREALVSDDLLTTQEQRVLALIAAGRTNAQIAELLTIAVSTVSRHISNLFAKLGVSNRTEAAIWWLERRR
jgi:DNA-binding NarL/FixJ family response regulator